MHASLSGWKGPGVVVDSLAEEQAASKLPPLGVFQCCLFFCRCGHVVRTLRIDVCLDIHLSQGGLHI
jgi:hypothetical protein